MRTVLMSLSLLCGLDASAEPPNSPATRPAEVQPAAVPAFDRAAAIAWLNEHAVPLASIDPDDHEDFSDLEPLKKLIGEAQVVALGEQTHGDGAVFFAKGRLIKFLHQQMGFDVLAWESGMYDCREVDRALRDASVPMEEVCRRGIFAIWTHSAQVRATLDYVRSTHSTERPLETAGFDEQFSGNVPSTFSQSMLAFLDAAGAGVINDSLRASLTDNFLGNPRPDKMKLEEVVALREQWASLPALIDAHREKLIAAHGEREFKFMRRVADDALICLDGLAHHLKPDHQFTAIDNNARDQRMGENLAWLANEHYKGRRIIAWEATFHAVHQVSQIVAPMNPGMYDGVKTCGQVAREALGERLYTIGFTAYDGKFANAFRSNERTLDTPAENSLEDLCRATGKPFLFIDFRSLPRDHWLRQPLVSRPLGYGEMRAVWPDQLDAMIYIQTMFPSTRSNALPPYARVRVEQ